MLNQIIHSLLLRDTN